MTSVVSAENVHNRYLEPTIAYFRHRCALRNNDVDWNFYQFSPSGGFRSERLNSDHFRQCAVTSLHSGTFSLPNNCNPAKLARLSLCPGEKTGGRSKAKSTLRRRAKPVQSLLARSPCRSAWRTPPRI